MSEKHKEIRSSLDYSVHTVLGLERAICLASKENVMRLALGLTGVLEALGQASEDAPTDLLDPEFQRLVRHAGGFVHAAAQFLEARGVVTSGLDHSDFRTFEHWRVTPPEALRHLQEFTEGKRIDTVSAGGTSPKRGLRMVFDDGTELELHTDGEALGWTMDDGKVLREEDPYDPEEQDPFIPEDG